MFVIFIRIPYNIAMKFWQALILFAFCVGCATGGQERAGVGLQEAAKENGILVKEVKEGGAAEKAGLQPGDVIVGYEGKRITDPGFVERDVEVSPMGRRVQLTILRAGKPMSLEMIIERARSRVVNVSPPGETPDYSVRVDDFLWLGSYPYPIDIRDVQDQLGLLPKAIRDQDQRPFTPADIFTVIIR
jgi:predicted metalloprotease with PDZ domain